MFGSLVVVGGQRVFAFRLVAVGIRSFSAGSTNNEPPNNLPRSTSTFSSLFIFSVQVPSAHKNLSATLLISILCKKW